MRCNCEACRRHAIVKVEDDTGYAIYEDGEPVKREITVCGPDGDYREVQVMGKRGWLPL